MVRNASLASRIRPCEIPNEDSDDVGVHQASDSGLTLGEITVQARVLHRNGRLRSEQLEDGHASRSERVRREVVFQVKNPEQSGLLQYRQAEHRSRVVLAKICASTENRLCADASCSRTLSLVRST